MRTVAHVDTLTQRNQARADLKVGQEKCPDLEEKLQDGPKDSHRSTETTSVDSRLGKWRRVTELSEKEEALNLQFFQKKSSRWRRG